MSVQSKLALKTRRIYLIGLTPVASIITIFIVTALAVSARTWFASPAGAKSPASASAPILGTLIPATTQEVAQGNSVKERIEAELITLTPRGFEPAEIKPVRGRFILAVDNHSGLDTVVLRLDRENGNSPQEQRMPQKRPYLRQVIDLIPGKYTLTEATHPNWICRITVTAP